MDLQTRIISLCNIRCRLDEIQLGKYGHVNPINSALTGTVLSSSWNLNYHHRIFVNVLFLRWYCNAFPKPTLHCRTCFILKDRYPKNDFRYFCKRNFNFEIILQNSFATDKIFIHFDYENWTNKKIDDR